jgi:hypothetical protein
MMIQQIARSFGDFPWFFIILDAKLMNSHGKLSKNHEKRLILISSNEPTTLFTSSATFRDFLRPLQANI